MTERLANYKNIDDILISLNDMPLSQSTQTTLKQKQKYINKKCNECNKRRKTFEDHQICRLCYKSKAVFKSSGSLDDFIKYTQINNAKNSGKMEFIPYDQFKDIEFIAEGGFSKIYKATWTDGPINWYQTQQNIYEISRTNNCIVVLKKLVDSKDNEFKVLNELKIFYQLPSKIFVCDYFGVTQDPVTEDMVIVMPYYNSGDLIRYINNDFYNISWYKKLNELLSIAIGLENIHKANIFHRDLHSGNIFLHGTQDKAYIVYDGLRPPIVTNAPEGYIELMKECWHSDSEKRPKAAELSDKIRKIWKNEDKSSKNKNSTKIMESSAIGPVTIDTPGAIYKSRPLSKMIHSVMSLRSSRSESINLETDKRKFQSLIDDYNGQSIKGKKLRENVDYLTNEIEFDINVDCNQCKSHNKVIFMITQSRRLATSKQDNRKLINQLRKDDKISSINSNLEDGQNKLMKRYRVPKQNLTSRRLTSSDLLMCILNLKGTDLLVPESAFDTLFQYAYEEVSESRQSANRCVGCKSVGVKTKAAQQ
ncbi:kinase-like domain-containing protein [Rhizophagus clarus]|uniref:Kinase-like domain-containing protein n=1 Tax=Rhizophagus clarus TaxID=94130 RepID=A0A8H3QLL7_9GLOM|nr:kinase-like domain-containing protein [Rhizophagus clarus]